MYGNRIAGRVSEYDQVLAEALAAVLTGDGADPVVPVTEDRLLELERTAALALAAKPESIARMRHLLATGKPLRN